MISLKYKFLVIAGIVIVGAVIALSFSKGIIIRQDYEIDVDPLKDPQNLFVTARV
ncbi:MAG: hypothetical protein HW420_1512, partial [Candidatus Nitrosotenuis sp.]|nr:hypothetical protein [Candidatus Nitrosotenuis sp.]